MVRRAAYGKIGKFTKGDMMELCLSIGKASIENALKKLERVLIRHGKGNSPFIQEAMQNIVCLYLCAAKSKM